MRYRVMFWIELIVEGPAEEAETVAAAMLASGIRGGQELGRAGGCASWRGFLPWSEEGKRAESRLRRALRRRSPELHARRRAAYEPRSLPSWCAGEPGGVEEPIRLSPRVLVTGPGVGGELELLPSRAFGRGTHPSTVVCAHLMETLLRPGERIVDVGTGSGVQALAAARLGAGRVLAVDFEMEAVRAARDNAIHNRLDEIVEVCLRHGLEEIDTAADGVLANLFPAIIRSVTPDVLRILRPGGWYVVSGIPSAEADAMEAWLRAQGLRVGGQVHHEGWCGMPMRWSG